ncbi:hypothetical protein B0H65DRAFT_100147 [Neurospora tetraspora]|uniref:Uncharacterized protein n=1 Tax=Neurospora tetraspora TaxID=94610 RepID=A0AAE0JKW1_9PEZI|nr:hypothetical protein B0H65DRAFT_100147 [Neurospora tetraspora]
MKFVITPGPDLGGERLGHMGLWASCHVPSVPLISPILSDPHTSMLRVLSLSDGFSSFSTSSLGQRSPLSSLHALLKGFFYFSYFLSTVNKYPRSSLGLFTSSHSDIPHPFSLSLSNHKRNLTIHTFILHILLQYTDHKQRERKKKKSHAYVGLRLSFYYSRKGGKNTQDNTRGRTTERICNGRTYGTLTHTYTYPRADGRKAITEQELGQSKTGVGQTFVSVLGQVDVSF